MFKNPSEDRFVKRECPACKKVKSFSVRNATCSPQCGYLYRSEKLFAKTNPVSTGADLSEAIHEHIRRSKKITFSELCDKVNQGPSKVRAAIDCLKEKGFNISFSESEVQLTEIPKTITKTPALSHNLADYQGKWVRFGVCGDKHLGNMHSRLDVLKMLYDIYEEEGITTVYDTGNWIDGEARFNKGELLVHGMDAQIDYWIENHPQKKGITTYFVAGDDHEGWYQQRECLEIGRYAMLRAKNAGREDLKYLGYAESVIELKSKRGSAHMMVNHPGGGSSYAVSYKGQKYVESLQSKEKPDIIIQGHYHKFNVGYPREVWLVDSGAVCDQTLFMRKKQLQAHVGGQIIELMQSPEGKIIRFRVEFLPFYDRTFYETQKRRFGLPSSMKKG